VLLADLVRNKTDHVFLHGAGAEMLARQFNLEMETDDYFYNRYRYEQWMDVKDTGEVRMDHTAEKPDKKFGTVGAVALDMAGDLAAATSTGGMTNKRYSRIGDTPVIGAGTYANNGTCAVSCTGHGEYFLRAVVAYDISCLIAYKNMSLRRACEFVVHDKLVKMGGEGGLIAIDRNGTPELIFNSEGMYRASLMQDSTPIIAIYK
jgi:beta-aspartyl-peptidase (threonine type)